MTILDGPRTSAPPWAVAGRGAAALAAAMGVGRFVYTPILPLMQDQAGLSAAAGATLATANYAGYLAGALAGIVAPALARSRPALRLSLLALVASLAAMPLTVAEPVWFALRFVAGVASALVFVVAVSAMLSRLGRPAPHLVGWGFGGVGVGIALSGLLVLVLQATALSGWRDAWWSAAALAAVLTAGAWRLAPEPAGAPAPARRAAGAPRTGRWFAALAVAYSLEGVGYIVAGTFLVAAISQGSPGWVGTGAWVLVGLAVVPASAGWALLARRWSRPSLLVAALLAQAVGIALPALAGGVVAALVSAVLFGATFLGISSLALAVGAHLQLPRAVAVLTAGYGVGQVLGPLVVAPLLGRGYHDALLAGAAIVLAAAVAAAVLRLRYPQRVGAAVEPSHLAAGR
jgi:predicted MFS family arabinose efflux permease